MSRRPGHRPLHACSEPGCPALTTSSRCDEHDRAADARRGRPRDRGYDSRWERNRTQFLAAHPHCIDCGAQATVADHDPLSRRELVAIGDPKPDAWHRLKPRCAPCHSSRTGHEQPGGWNRR